MLEGFVFGGESERGKLEEKKQFGSVCSTLLDSPGSAFMIAKSGNAAADGVAIVCRTAAMLSLQPLG